MSERRYSRRGAIRLAGRVLTGAALAGMAGTGAVRSLASAIPTDNGSMDRPLRIGYLPITDAGALLAAYEQGFLSQNGVAAERPIMFRTWDSLAQALTTDRVDVVHMLMPMALQLRVGKRAPIQVTAWGHTNGSTLTVAPGIPDVAGLAGKRVAIPFWWSVHNVLLQRLLGASGLRGVIGSASSAERTVELVVMPPSDMVPALEAGAIAGFVVADPFSALAESSGAGHVLRFLGDVWRDHACCAITVREQLTTEHPDVAMSMTSAIVQAQRWLDRHRDEAAEVLSPTGYLPQPVDAVDRVFNRPADDYAEIIRHNRWNGERLGFSAYPAPSYTEALVDLLKQTVVDGNTDFLDGLTGAQAHRDLVDDRFVTAALRSAGYPIPERRELIQP